MPSTYVTARTTTPSGQARRVSLPHEASHTCASPAANAYGHRMTSTTPSESVGSCERLPPDARASTHTKSATSGKAVGSPAAVPSVSPPQDRSHSPTRMNPDWLSQTSIGMEPRPRCRRHRLGCSGTHLGREPRLSATSRRGRYGRRCRFECAIVSRSGSPGEHQPEERAGRFACEAPCQRSVSGSRASWEPGWLLKSESLRLMISRRSLGESASSTALIAAGWPLTSGASGIGITVCTMRSS